MPRHVHPMPFVIKPPADFVKTHPELRRWSAALSIQFAGGLPKEKGLKAIVAEEDLEAMGRLLWQALGIQDDFEKAHKAAGAAILPVIIETDSADVHALPWETLYHPELGFLGKQRGFTLSRRIGEPAGSAPHLEQGPLRVLLFTALPDDVDPERERLNVEEEQVQVQAALLPWVAKGLVDLEMPDDGRFATLKELLDSFHPHVLFLSGHGKFHHAPHTGEAPYGEFLFEGETGASDPVNEAAIAGALVGMGVRLVVLSACESGKAASDALSHGLAQRLSAQGIPHVIGMRESIYDSAGTKFERALCDDLAQRERVDAALQSARMAIQTPLKDIARKATAQVGEAEALSLGQWCLPMLLSRSPAEPLIDWDFPPRERKHRCTSRSLDTISLPPRFVGRRAELRNYKSAILQGALRKLLITGPGGQGKTALAGKLAWDLQGRGYRVFGWAARPENAWRDFELTLELALDGGRAKHYGRFCAHYEDASDRAAFMVDLLLEQFEGRVVFFLDNLETVQAPQGEHAITEPVAAAWVAVLQKTADATLLVTSRWQLPDWRGESLRLSRANYGDFLQLAQELAGRGQLQRSFLEDRARLRQVYNALGGNSRGLEFFAAATLTMASAAEDALLERLAQVKGEMQLNMALEALYAQLPERAKTLLSRLPAYHDPVPAEGLLKLGLDLAEDPARLLDALLAVSLLEAQYEPAYQVIQYQCPPLATDWLRENNLVDEDQKWLEAVADYHGYLWIYERPTLRHAILTHHALRRAGRHAEADRLTLDVIVGPYTRAGRYGTLLDTWLPRICDATDPQTRAEALGQTGKLHLHLGKFKEAMPYFEQALAIWQRIGDTAGEGTTLNNISQIFKAQGDYETALGYLHQALALWQRIGYTAGEGATLNNIATLYHAQGAYETALGYLHQALAIQQRIGDTAGEGTTLNNISQIYHAQGAYETALGYLHQALAIRQRIGDTAGEGTTLNNIATLYHAQGDYETALGYLHQALAIQQRIGDTAGEGATLNNIGQIFKAQGDYETALGYLHQALAISQRIGDTAGEGTTLNNISGIYWAQGDYETALGYLHQALAICQRIGDTAGEGATLNNIGQIFKAQGDYETALGYLHQALAIQQRIGDTAGLCLTLFNMGHLHAQNNDIEAAVSAWVTVYQIAKQINYYQVLQALSQLAPRLGMPEGLAGWERLAQRMAAGA